jgi:hypothetical protein
MMFARPFLRMSFAPSAAAAAPDSFVVFAMWILTFCFSVVPLVN